MTTDHKLHKLALPGILHHLTTLYYEGGNLEPYYQALAAARQRLHYAFPGLTIVLAEVADRDYAPAMTHVLAPEMAKTEHTLGWHDTFMGRLSLDDGQTTLSEVASCEVKEADGSWLSGTVAAGGAASQSYILTTSAGVERILQHGDSVRKVTFRDD